MSTPRTWSVTFTETTTHRVTVTLTDEIPDGPDFPDRQAAALLELARDQIGAGETIVSSGAHFVQADPVTEPAPQYPATLAALDAEVAALPLAIAPAATVAAYPHRDEDAATLARLGVAPDVAARVLAYLQHLNESDAEAQTREAGNTDSAGRVVRPRWKWYGVDTPAKPGKYVRLRYTGDTDDDRPSWSHASVLSFLEIATGTVWQHDGWKRKGTRRLGELATDAGLSRLIG